MLLNSAMSLINRLEEALSFYNQYALVSKVFVTIAEAPKRKNLFNRIPVQH